MICVLGVGWWWGEERTKQALQAQMVIEKLLSFFWYTVCFSHHLLLDMKEQIG